MIMTKQNILDKVIISAVNKDNVKDGTVYLNWNDLALTFKFEVCDGGYATINETLMSQLGISIEELVKVANRNMDIDIVNMSELFDVFTPFGSVDITIITNKKKMYGAGTIFKTDVFRDIADAHGKDLYILPSSIHEVLIIDAITEDVDYLINMVREINEGFVAPEDRLSDNVYRYWRELDTITMM